MSTEEIQHYVDLSEVQVATEEAIANTMLASAARARQQLVIIKQLLQENQTLRQAQQPIHIEHVDTMALGDIVTTKIEKQ